MTVTSRFLSPLDSVDASGDWVVSASSSHLLMTRRSSALRREGTDPDRRVKCEAPADEGGASAIRPFLVAIERVRTEDEGGSREADEVNDEKVALSPPPSLPEVGAGRSTAEVNAGMKLRSGLKRREDLTEEPRLWIRIGQTVS